MKQQESGCRLTYNNQIVLVAILAIILFFPSSFLQAEETDEEYVHFGFGVQGLYAVAPDAPYSVGLDFSLDLKRRSGFELEWGANALAWDFRGGGLKYKYRWLWKKKNIKPGDPSNNLYSWAGGFLFRDYYSESRKNFWGSGIGFGVQWLDLPFRVSPGGPSYHLYGDDDEENLAFNLEIGALFTSQEEKFPTPYFVIGLGFQWIF